jgi:D-serine deaminase-like pyridoxal phosphate-dependent protein
MLKPPSENYFNQLNTVLKKHDRAIPFLLIDLDTLDKNIDTLKTTCRPDIKLRIAAKSLPSFELITYIMKRLETDKLMVFHQPFLTDLSSKLNGKADILLGKPMPIKTAAYYYNNLPKQENGFNPYRQIQWLVDTEDRIIEYANLADKLGKKLLLNLEIDVGLHRGGFNNLSQLRKTLKLINSHANKLIFSGFMGYDPHIVKIPNLLRSQKKSLALSNEFYHQCINLVKDEFPLLWNETLTFNGAGSPTVNLHQSINTPLNDITASSCLVKPTTFDIDSLKSFEPAAFIATPVLKKFKGTTLPGLEKWKTILNFISPVNHQSFFIYGGFWKADYCHPKGLKQNSLFGASTNQTMLNGPDSMHLELDDFVFLRPHQSEFVFLQFGNILTFRNHEIQGEWTLLHNI